jgi:hypothetical protein
MSRKYPVSVNFVRDRDDKDAPIMIESEINRKNIQNAIRLMNFVHFAVSEFMNPERSKSIRNQEAPFYAMHQGNIQIHHSAAKITDTSVASADLVYSLLKEFTTNQSLAPESLARFLNDIYRSRVPGVGPNPTSDIFVGGNKPIGKKETP